MVPNFCLIFVDMQLLPVLSLSLNLVGFHDVSSRLIIYLDSWTNCCNLLRNCTHYFNFTSVMIRLSCMWHKHSPDVFPSWKSCLEVTARASNVALPRHQETRTSSFCFTSCKGSWEMQLFSWGLGGVIALNKGRTLLPRKKRGMDTWVWCHSLVDLSTWFYQKSKEDLSFASQVLTKPEENRRCLQVL